MKTGLRFFTFCESFLRRVFWHICLKIGYFANGTNCKKSLMTNSLNEIRNLLAPHYCCF